MSIRMKLSIKYINNSYFLLTILGKYRKVNKRKINIEGNEYTVNSVKICITEKSPDFFDIKFSKNIALFISHSEGMYKLPITSTQHILAETSHEGMLNYITVESSDGKEKQDVVYIPVLTTKNM